MCLVEDRNLMPGLLIKQRSILIHRLVQETIESLGLFNKCVQNAF